MKTERIESIVVHDQEFKMEVRHCASPTCGKPFKVATISKQVMCSAPCNYEATGKGGADWMRDKRVDFEAKQKLKREFNKKVDAHVAVKAKEARVKAVVDKSVETSGKLVQSKPKLVQSVIDPVDQLTPSAEELVHQRWLSYVERARNMVKSASRLRMDIADLAIGACEIHHGGGDHWKGHEGVHTLKNFATEVGVNYKTLHGWVRVRQLVKPVVDDVWDDSDWGAAIRTCNRISKSTSKEEVRKRYKSELLLKGPRTQFRTLVKSMSRARHFLKTVELSKLDREDLSTMLELSGEVHRRLSDSIID